jgi:hypothetical protein
MANLLRIALTACLAVACTAFGAETYEDKVQNWKDSNSREECATRGSNQPSCGLTAMWSCDRQIHPPIQQTAQVECQGSARRSPV